MAFTNSGLVSRYGLGGMQTFCVSLYSTVEQVNFLSLCNIYHLELSQIAILAIGFPLKKTNKNPTTTPPPPPNIHTLQNKLHN